MKKEHFLQSEGFKTVAASVLSILIGLAVGSIVILIVGLTSPNLSLSSAWDGIRIVFGGLFSTGRDASGTLTWGFNPTNIGNMLFRAAPLIMTGLSVGMAYKTGLFNIGAPGQYLIGTLVSLSIALGLPSETMSTTLIWLLAFLGGTLAGAIWGAIPGLFKALLNINEVLACIMTNWIAANLVTWLFDISNFKNVTESTKTGYIYKTTYNGVATAKMGLDKLFPNSQVNGGILIAIVFAIAVYVLMSKTTFGYQLKACGSNRHAARYAGIADKRNIVISMAIAGGLSAAGASLYYLSGNTEFFWSTYQSLPAIGFNGIPVAMLASCNPIGIIFTALFMSMLDISGLQLTNLTAYNEYITNVIIAVIVYLSAFSLVIKMWIQQTLIYAVPLMIVALAGVFAERSGIINLALEGIMVFGAFIGVWFVRILQTSDAILSLKQSGNWVALQGVELLTMLVAAAFGALFSLLLSFASINLRADQTIGGTALNLMAPALVLFFIRIIANQNTLQMLTGDAASWFMIKKSTLGIDKNTDLGFFGETFVNKVYLATYVCILLFIILSILLYKTRFGLRLRACGENPQAADSLGINVYKMRYAGTTISGALAGMGGFVYALTTANCASNGDVAGFGFLALAVMIFGNWKPVNIAVSSLLFGLFKCIAASYASIDINGDGVFMLAEIGISAHLYRMLPYIVTLLVLAFTSKSSRAPKAEGIPYDKGQR